MGCYRSHVVCVCVCVLTVITSTTAGECRVCFDGKLGEGVWRWACYMAVAPQAQLLPSFFCLISALSEGSRDGGRGRNESRVCTWCENGESVLNRSETPALGKKRVWWFLCLWSAGKVFEAQVSHRWRLLHPRLGRKNYIWPGSVCSFPVKSHRLTTETIKYAVWDTIFIFLVHFFCG